MKHTTFKLLLVAAMAVTLLFAAACAVDLQDEMGEAMPEPALTEDGMQADAPAIMADEAREEVQDGVGLSGFTANDLDGNAVTDAVFSNVDLTMINVWATFCGPCLQEMPDLGELADEYSGKGVQIIGIVSDAGESEEDIASVRAIVEKTGAGYVQLLPSAYLLENLLLDMRYVPTTLFVDRNGNLVGDMIVGSNSKTDWKTIIDERLTLAQGGQDSDA